MRKILIVLTVFMASVYTAAPAGAQKQMNVVLISGSNEYISNISLTNYKEYLEKNEGVRVTLLKAGGPLNKRDEYSELAGVEALDDADAVLIFLRRTTISGDTL